MGAHDHHDHHRDYSDNKDLKNLGWAFFLNFSFTLIEIAGGIFTNSVAILADAIHDMGDTLALGLAWYFQRLSKKGRNKKYSYGYKRFSVLGALISSLVLIIGSGFILFETLPRLWNPEESNAEGMVILAALGLTVNGLAYFRVRKGDSLNERVVSLHLLEDVLGWFIVLIGGTVMIFWDVPILDPLLSLIIFAFILFNVIKNLRQVVLIIMQGSPSPKSIEKVEDYLNSTEEVNSFHDLHLWTMDGKYHILSVHLVLKENHDLEAMQELKREIRKGLKELSIEHATIEFEQADESCDFDC